MKKFFALFAALFLAAGLYAEVAVPAWIDTWVVDQAGILTSAQESQINAYCKAIEDKTTMQFGVLTVESLEGESIEHFAIRVFEKWKLGQKGKDNGCLFIISVKDRVYRIEVGYGLEETLTDLKTGRIGRDVVEPKLGAGDWSGGIMATVKALYETASGDVLEANDAYSDISSANYTLSSSEESGKQTNWRLIAIIAGIIIVLVILDFIFTGGEITTALLLSSSSSSGSYHSGSSSHHSGGGGRSGGGGHSGHF